MIDLEDLFAKIEAQVAATPALSPLHGKVWYDFVPQTTPARPWCRYSIVADTTDQFYGSAALDQYLIQFSVFAKTRTEAADLSKAMAEAFHGTTLTLDTDTNVGCRREPGVRIRHEGETAKEMVFHAMNTVRFMVQGQA
jgi:hypothetical protein